MGMETFTAKSVLNAFFTGLECWPAPIPVSERLPDDGDDVLVLIKFARDGFVDWGVGSQVAEDWRIWGQCCQETEGCEDEDREVTHWLPFPPKPAASATESTLPEPPA